MSRIEEIDKIVDEIGDADSLYKFAEGIYEDRQRIAELEEQLRNSRVKFFIGFDSDFNLAVKELDLNIVLPNWMHDKEFKFYDTKEEALAKLRELQEK